MVLLRIIFSFCVYALALALGAAEMGNRMDIVSTVVHFNWIELVRTFKCDNWACNASERMDLPFANQKFHTFWNWINPSPIATMFAWIDSLIKCTLRPIVSLLRRFNLIRCSLQYKVKCSDESMTKKKRKDETPKSFRNGRYNTVKPDSIGSFIQFVLVWPQRLIAILHKHTHTRFSKIIATLSKQNTFL